MLKVNIEKKFSDIIIKSDFVVEAKGVTALFGKSGAGKTSIIKMVSGLVTPDSGEIIYKDTILFSSSKNINIPVHKRFIGYVFQESRLFPHMDIKSNLLYGSKRKHNNSFHADFDQVVNLLGIEHLLNRMPSNLSGGEKQRTAIGRALLSNPAILLMDEPLASLDMLRRKELLNYINIIAKHIEIPIIYVSHSVEEILKIASNTAFIDKGSLLYYGSTVSMLNKINRQILDDFIYFKGIVKSVIDNNIITIESNNVLFKTYIENSGLKNEQNIYFSIKSDDILISYDNITSINTDNVYQGIVTNISFDNNVYVVSIDIGINIFVKLQSINIRDKNVSISDKLSVIIKNIHITDY